MALGVAACLASLSASQPLPPAPGAWTPSYQAPEPLYFSGTNARASGAGYTGGLVNGQTVYVVTAVLKLNGETVRTYQWQSGEPQVSSVSLAVMFDSSHFAHGSTVTVDFVFLDSLGTWRQDDMQAPVKNRLISYGHHNPAQQPRGAPVPVGVLAGLNYATHMRDADGWTGPEMLADMDGATVVHYSGHGASGVFNDDLDANVYAIGSTTTPAVEGYRVIQMGTGNPPFNSTAAPPVHFAFLNSCQCGLTNDFIRFCIPYMNGYGQWLENQAVLAFKVVTYAHQNARRGEIVYDENLAAGLPAEAARLSLYFSFEIECQDGLYEGLLRPDDPRLYGDDYTRVKGVYLPSLAASVDWRRSL